MLVRNNVVKISPYLRYAMKTADCDRDVRKKQYDERIQYI